VSSKKVEVSRTECLQGADGYVSRSLLARGANCVRAKNGLSCSRPSFPPDTAVLRTEVKGHSYSYITLLYPHRHSFLTLNAFWWGLPQRGADTEKLLKKVMVSHEEINVRPD